MGISTERIPKSVARVLDAARIRAEYKEKKRAAQMQMDGGVAADAKANDDHADGAPKLPPRKKRRTNAGAGVALMTNGKEEEHRLVDTRAIEIQPGESLKHFNRLVERPILFSHSFSL